MTCPRRPGRRSPGSSTGSSPSTPPGDFVEDWDIDELLRRLEEVFPASDEFAEIDFEHLDRDELTEVVQEEALARYAGREAEFGPELMRDIERYLLLEIIDQRWQEHLYDMDYLQQGIYLRGAAQLDPLIAYKNEAFDLFQDLMHSVWHDFARFIYHVEVTVQDEAAEAQPGPRRPPAAHARHPARPPAEGV